MPAPRPVAMKDVFSTWWPLAASWLLMGFEQPAASAVMTRLPDPVHALAAFGGIVFPIGLVIEAPIIMLLAASTALSRDAQSYRLGLRMTHAACAVLTVVHALVAFTPVYDAVVTHLLQAPAAVVEPGRLGLRILLPWAGVEWGGATGLYVAVAATVVGNAALVAWLRIRAAEAWSLPVI
ncbi:MAG: hypothetical protein FJ087_05960 [Deltaproteobacteria bacterium]|nr:hypothetical protein [Deltaproteobacteria bacterium]